jgi:GNAT superfamily N-acetyltransferase
LTYTIGLERGDLNYAELEPNYRRHYEEMRSRLSADGIEVGEYNPRLAQYFESFAGGWLLNYVLRFNGEAVGHANLTQDMHNSEPIAQEDMIYVVPEHRNGMGRKLAKYVLADLKRRGVKRLNIAAVTDLRAEKLWRRMGFRPTAAMMTHNLEA